MFPPVVGASGRIETRGFVQLIKGKSNARFSVIGLPPEETHKEKMERDQEIAAVTEAKTR